MRRIIQDFATMRGELRDRVREAYPDGIQGSDLLSFPIANGKRLYGIEIRTPEAIYLIKGDFSESTRRPGFFVLEAGEDEERDVDDEDAPGRY